MGHRVHPRLKFDNTTLQGYTLLLELGDHILQQKLFLPYESLQVLISSLKTINLDCGCLKLSLDCQHLYAVIRFVVFLPAITRGGAATDGGPR